MVQRGGSWLTVAFPEMERLQVTETPDEYFPKCLNFQKQFATTLQKISYHHENKILVEG